MVTDSSPIAPTGDSELGFGLFGPVLARGATPDLPRLSIAVLPFVTLGSTEQDRYLADGITEDLINCLSRISGTMVIGRSTMFTYKDRAADARDVGRDLRVRHAVTGTVRRTRERIQVNVELVDTGTGAQDWAEKFEHEASDWQSVSDAVSGRIARALNLELMSAGTRSRFSPRALPLHAAELAMRGWVELFNKPQTPESNATAQRWLNEALAIDRELSLAWTGLAYATYRAASFGWAGYSLDDGMQRAVDCARHAIGLDPRAADAYYAMGQSLNAIGELEQAQAAHEKCMALNPSHAPAYAALGQVRMFQGHPEETAGLCARAFLLSPREPLRAIWHRTLGLATLFLGDSTAAAREARSAIALNPEYPSPFVVLAAAEVRLGHPAAAREAIARMREISTLRDVESVRLTLARPRSERYSSFLEGLIADLRKAGLPG